MGSSRDRTTWTNYELIELTPDQLIKAYRGNWIARKVVDIPAFDSVREWRNWQAGDDQIEKLEEGERRLQVRPKLARALKLARLLGGAAIVLGVDQGQPDEPLEIERVGAGGLKFIHVASRLEITAGEVQRNPPDPRYGEPVDYEFSTGSGETIKRQPSRVIRLVGAEYPDTRTSVDGWGDSVLQAVDSAIKNAGVTAQGIAGLLEEAK